MNIQCDKCNKEFPISTIATEDEQLLSNNVTRHYISCPSCGEQYTSYFLDDSMREIQEEIRRLKNKQELTTKQKNKLMRLTQSISSMNIEYMNTYKDILQDNA
ncbi:hypothetical protein [Cytobacillus kochii]|uniref:hypothetical protein n=1 Tax=Cytobacillus kochii TaxID=859143 RepID=UPI00402A71C8